MSTCSIRPGQRRSLVTPVALPAGSADSVATILAHITVREGTEARFEAIAKELFVSTHSTEIGVRAYDYWRSAEPRAYYSLLSFDNFPAFIAHQTSGHHETASPVLGAIIEAIHLEWVDPIAGASRFVPTEATPLPDDADDLSIRYAKRFAAQIADWWLALR